jgi:hypothetical protein
VSSVWETRYHLLIETLENTVERLRDEKAHTPAEPTEQTVRVVVGVLMLLRQHRVNKRGQCRYCGWTRWYWRVWRRQPQCTVFRSLDFVVRQPVELVMRLGSDSDIRADEGKPGRLERKSLDE